MDTQIVAFAIIMAGALCGVIIPYLLKMHEEGIEFNMSYMYGMVISLIVAAFAIVPDAVPLEFKPLFTLFLAGAALQTVINKANTMRIKKAEE